MVFLGKEYIRERVAPGKGLGIWSPEGWPHILLLTSFVTTSEVLALQNFSFFMSKMGEGNNATTSPVY